MQQIENDIEKKLVSMIRAQGGRCVKWTAPGETGVPDRICFLPGGRVYYVELKRPQGGRVAAKQQWWKRELEKLGQCVLIIKNEAQIEKLRKEITQGEAK